ncbi:MAG: ABC transporter ATP-binding protein [Candidatus Eremiobacterota bacterium]
MLQACDLVKDFPGHRAVDRLNLAVEPGQVYCLLGANGAGKTTTLNLFLGFLEPTSGQALVGGRAVTEDPLGARRQLTYIPEQVTLYPHLTGLENLEYFCSLSGVRRGSAELRGFLSRSGLQEEAHERRVSGYSKGMRQKVGIALALAREARALLLDEPTSGLDPKASYEFSELLKQISAAGVAVLMATHDLFRVKEVGSRVGIMRTGRLVAEMSVEELGHRDLEQLYLEHMRE